MKPSSYYVLCTILFFFASTAYAENDFGRGGVYYTKETYAKQDLRPPYQVAEQEIFSLRNMARKTPLDFMDKFNLIKSKHMRKARRKEALGPEIKQVQHWAIALLGGYRTKPELEKAAEKFTAPQMQTLSSAAFIMHVQNLKQKAQVRQLWMLQKD